MKVLVPYTSLLVELFQNRHWKKQAQKKFLQNMAHQKVYSMQVRGALLLKVFIVYAAFWILISLMLTVISVRLWNFKDGGS